MIVRQTTTTTKDFIYNGDGKPAPRHSMDFWEAASVLEAMVPLDRTEKVALRIFLEEYRDSVIDQKRDMDEAYKIADAIERFSTFAHELAVRMGYEGE